MFEIELIQVTFGVRDSLSRVPSEKEWDALFAFAERHSLLGVLFDGVERLPKEQMPEIALLVNWYSQVEYVKRDYCSKRASIECLVKLWESEGLKVVELKGDSIGRYYPHPELRYSCDYDCLLSDYEAGNRIVEDMGVRVDRNLYKNSSFTWRGVYVENHQFCTPVRGNKQMKHLEIVLRDLISKNDMVNFNALFLMEHMWSHFFEEALTMKQVCDWLVLRKECGDKVDWELFGREAKACGFWRFSVSVNKICDLILCGNGDDKDDYKSLNGSDLKLWKNMLKGGGSIQMNKGWKTRLQLVGNYFANNWKYRYFHNHSAIFILARTALAFILERSPKIDIK